MERIKGFTIELELDNMKVDSGLTDLKTSMRQMNSEMRSNMSQFDFGEKSIKKYGVQLDGLNKKYELQQKVVEDTRKRYEALRKEKGENHSDTQKAAAAYNHELAQLNNLERHIGKVTDEMKAFKREQEIQSSTMWKTGDALKGFGDKLGTASKKARDLGGTLTKRLTLPALGVVTAITGITAALGWGRLKSVDAAQAQLKGLGYEAEDVERISGQLSEALEGGMLTMGEATSAAATAMASGVKEGKDLQRYIQILDGTVAGSTGTFQEMEQIFGRIVDQGNMTRNEFDMIAQRMPGFSKAVQENMKISSDEMYEMLRNGEITTDQFLDIMEDFSGDMATEYAKSWDGMVKNTKAYIGIIGENLLGGVFQESKEAIADLIEFLSSDQMIAWAQKMGEKIGEVFTVVVSKVRGAIEWFANLNNTQQKLILGVGAFVVSIGPLLVGLGTIGGIIAKVSTGLGSLLQFIAPITQGFGLFGGAAAKTGGAVAATGKSVGLLSRVFTFFTGPVGIAIGVLSLLVGAFITAYKRSETFRDFIQDLGDKIKGVFGKITDWMRPGLNAVTNFFGSMKEKITGFKNEEGADLIKAFQNIGSFISVVAKGIWTGIKWTFEQIKWIIADYVMPVVEFVVKMVWDNIKGVISGALDVIMGAIKIFSGLFTGDWSKMWEGTKQLVVGAVKAVWNYINLLFIGRILKGIGVLVKSFGGLIGRMWTGTKATFLNGITAVWNWMKNSFVGRIISSIINFVKNFRTNISSLWTRVKDLFKQRIIEIYNNFSNSFVGRIITGIINFAKNFRTNLSNMWQRVRTLFTDRITSIRKSIADSFVGRMLSSIRNLRTNFINIAKDMWSGVKKQFGNIVDGAKALPGRIGRGIKSMRSKATDGMKSVGNSIIRWAGKPFNKVIDGVNWVTSKLGVKTNIDHWSIPQFAKGTGFGGHKGGMAMIGEKGRELVKLPDGRSFVSPDSHTVLDLPKGTHVIPNKQTEQILKSDLPHYADGTKGWFDSFKSSVGEVWDYVKNPGKIVSKLIEKIALKTGMAEIPKSIVSAGFNYVKDKPREYLKTMFKENKDNNPNIAGAGKPAFGGPVTSPFGYRIHPISGARKLHGGVDFGAPSGTPVPSQTGGIVSFAGGGWNGGFGNLVRVKQGIWEMFYAHLSKILVSAGQSVTKGQILGNVGSTGASTGPHLHYETRKNGVRVNPMNKFATGAIIKSPMMAMVGEEDEEIIIPTARHRRTDAMKLLALAAKKIGADNGSFTRPSGISGKDDSDNEENEMLKLLMEQNEHLKLSNELLTRLLGKDLDLYKLNKKVDKGLNIIGDRKSAAWGG